MRRIPVIMWPIAGIVVLLLIVAAFIITGPRLTQVSTTTPLVPGESLKMSEVQYDQDKEGGQGWELVAKEAHFFDTTQIVSLKDVLLTLDSTEDNSYTIRGNEGDYCRKSEEIVLKGRVVGTSKSGYQLETTQLTYKQKEESVVTEKPVKVIGPFFRVKGEGLYIDLKRNRFMVKRNVFTTIKGGEFF